MKEIYFSTLKIAYSKIEECKSRGILVDIRSKEFIDIEIEIENCVEIQKLEIFKKFCLLHYEDSPSLIVHKAIEKFSRESSEFDKKLKDIEEEYRVNVELIMNDRMTQENFQKIIQQ